MANLPDYLPRAATEAFAELRRDELLTGSADSLDSLIHRQCMGKVWQELAEKLTGPEAWPVFLLDALQAANTAEAWRPVIKPARLVFDKRREQAARAGREFLSRLGDLAEGWAGYRVPHELNSLAPLLIHAAGRKGIPAEAAMRLYEPLLDDDHARLSALIDGKPVPDPLTPADVVGALVGLLEEWNTSKADEHPEQTQGTKAPQVFVRAINRTLREHSEQGRPGFPPLEVLPHGRLLTLESLARLTRAALDLPDEPPGYPYRQPFDAEAVRRALESMGGDE